VFLRFVQVKINPEQLDDLRELYEEKIIPVLATTEGCLYIGLISAVRHPEECISMTLWSDKQKAEAYQRSSAFTELLGASQQYFDGSSEWQLQLSEDLTLNYSPVVTEPTIIGYTISSSPDMPAVPSENSLYVRIVSHKVNPDMQDEFKKIYTEAVMPMMRKVQGCRYAGLTERLKEDGKMFSVTIWDSQADAYNYERSGLFESFVKKLTPALSGIYKWKVQIERETGAQVVTTDDVTVEGYNVITGRSFLAGGSKTT